MSPATRERGACGLWRLKAHGVYEYMNVMLLACVLLIMMTGSQSSRKRTMAEAEEALRLTKESTGCRRSSRRSQCIITSPYHRLHQLFWQTDTTTTNSKLSRVFESPNIFVTDHFLTASELEYCDSLIEKSKFAKSFVDNEAYASDSSRTSTYISLDKLQNASVLSIERRAAELLGISIQCIEPLQLVRYRVGEFFGTHHDLGILYDDGSVELPAKNAYSKRRMATIFCYLNDVENGGCTYFPKIDLRVTPKRGRAVMFPNISKDGMPDPQTVHEGEPPVSGIKYGLNIWACEE